MVRIVTYNVRRFAHGKGRQDTVDLVLKRLVELSPISLLALNEVDVALRPHALSQLQDVLGLEHVAFFGHAGPSNNYGNAILSREPFVQDSVRQTHLRGGKVVLDKDGREHRIVRGLQTVRTTLGGVAATVAVTHLDHMDEAERVTQMSHALSCIDEAQASEDCTLLLGDMNALRRTDYSSTEWAAHVAYNSGNGWKPPSDSEEPNNSLGLLFGAGFRDCVRTAMGVSPPQVRGGDEHVRWTAPPWTAHVHTAGAPRYRIDYIFARSPTPKLAFGQPVLKCVRAQTLNTTDDGGASSDHCPVVADFVVAEHE